MRKIRGGSQITGSGGGGNAPEPYILTTADGIFWHMPDDTRFGTGKARVYINDFYIDFGSNYYQELYNGSGIKWISKTYSLKETDVVRVYIGP